MRIKTLTDAAADFRSRALKRAYASGMYDSPGEAAADEIIKALSSALSGDGYEEALRRFDSAGNGTAGAHICSACRDTGHLNGQPCVCFKAYIYRECYGAADVDGLTESFKNFDLSLFDDEDILIGDLTQRGVMELAKKYAEKYAHGLKAKPNLLLSGNAGLGKTYLLRSIARCAKSAGADVLLISYPALHELFHRHRMGEAIDFTYLNNAGMLLIDDLGAEPNTANVSVEYLFSLLDYRINAKLPTAVTTNVPNLARRYTDPVASRLMSGVHGKNFIFEGKDLRRKNSKFKVQNSELW